MTPSYTWKHLLWHASGYINCPARVLEDRIGTTLPERFAIIFDGCSASAGPYVAVFETFSKSCTGTVLWGLFTYFAMGSEDACEAWENWKFAEYTFDDYGKSEPKVITIAEGKMAMIRAFARILGPLFVGCHSHCFKLAIKHFFW